MDKKLKAKWVKALRSGKFEQGQHFLRDATTGSFCCLGVLREIQEPGCRYDNERTAYLAPEHRGGLKDDQMDQVSNGMNDKGKTFKEIAAFIVKNF